MSDSKYFIGCQSWGYADWVTPAGGETVFYPRSTGRDEMLSLYARIYNTVEVDATVYGIPPVTSFQKWHDETPEDFVFSLKTPREITHELLLRGRSIEIMHEFIERSKTLKEKLGPILIQFPSSFESNAANTRCLEDFLAQLPADADFAVEFRHPDWFDAHIFEMLESNSISLCLTDGKWIDRKILMHAAVETSLEFRYIRIMGVRDMIKFDRISRHRDAEIKLWTALIKSMKSERIYIYLDNYFEGFAPGTADKFTAALGLAAKDPADLEAQGSLF